MKVRKETLTKRENVFPFFILSSFIEFTVMNEHEVVNKNTTTWNVLVISLPMKCGIACQKTLILT